MRTLTLSAVAAMLPLAAMAESQLTVSDAYARSSRPEVGAAFMQIQNPTDQACELIAATSSLSDRVELHMHKEDANGVMQMMKSETGFPIPAQGEHALARGGDHIMFFGLEKPLENGGDVPVTLDFGPCGTLDVVVPVDNNRMPMHQMKH
ncbi:MAG: copper chaperone PCu(A)C [Paracoccus sp. (in: a-proteobacteria)]|uniref:copper chaperone PCu(A)C n=1 Tax=Paracoccus sp. TaxID=267 RepID=UPI0026E0877B|nr:copper chaperone PCu(A)C [Paracoccus sp. (in: a-proteobacteria)]MDO5620461.1 copper chaperone PCu(A)C [Paracoccus sp. (in: a-proteobacteria)]